VQAERADLRLETPRIQLLGLPGTGLECDHGHPLLARRTTRMPLSPRLSQGFRRALRPHIRAAVASAATAIEGGTVNASA